MDGTIIESTKELERTTYATYALRTYYNYIQAWVVCLERLYGASDDGENAFLEKFKSTVAFKHVQGAGLVSEEFCNAYGRGRLILKASAIVLFIACKEAFISPSTSFTVGSFLSSGFAKLAKSSITFAALSVISLTTTNSLTGIKCL